jgi:hypothetical protein
MIHYWIKIFLCINLAFLCITAADAQHRIAHGRDTVARIGVGIGINPIQLVTFLYEFTHKTFIQHKRKAFESTPLPAMMFAVPLRISSAFRLEPEIGILSLSRSFTKESPEAIIRTDYDESFLRAGIGFTGNWEFVDEYRFALGVRGGIVPLLVKSENAYAKLHTRKEGVSTYYAPFFALEHPLIDDVTIALEAQLSFYHFVDDVYNDDAATMVYNNTTRIATADALIVFRWQVRAGSK